MHVRLPNCKPTTLFDVYEVASYTSSVFPVLDGNVATKQDYNSSTAEIGALFEFTNADIAVISENFELTRQNLAEADIIAYRLADSLFNNSESILKLLQLR